MTNVSSNESNRRTGLIDTADGGNEHQLQLWIEQRGDGWFYRIFNHHMPGGRIGRRGELDTGDFSTDYDDVLSTGQAAFKKLKSKSDSQS